MRPKFIAALASAATSLSFVSAWSSGHIQLDKGLLPKLDCELPILSLGSPAAIPQDLLKQFVSVSAPNATFVTEPRTREQYAYDGDTLVALVEAGGETRVFPNFGTFGPAEGPICTDTASKYIRNRSMFPKDDTNFSVVAGSNLFGRTLRRDLHSNRRTNTHASDPQLYLSHAVVSRNITSDGKDYAVCGPGSLASFGFSADGKVRSLSYLWHPATLTKDVVKTRATDVIYDSILKELSCASKGGSAKVDSVDICFYDSGLKYIQPVYRFFATLNPESGTNGTGGRPNHIVGYIPVGDSSPEALPSLNVSDEQVVKPTQPKPPVESHRHKRGVKPDIKVGRYVGRIDQDQNEFYRNSNNFMAGFRNTYANFIDSQYLFAWPHMFTYNRNTFINSVHIAEVLAHGNWHLFATLKDCCDLVTLDSIPAEGYGGSGGGSLAYWILYSCEAIPTLTDYSVADRHKAWDPWWHIFNGLHAVVGYRTEALLSDGVAPKVASLVSLKAPFVPTWLQAAIDSPSYARRYSFPFSWKYPTYYDFNRNMDQPFGRPSAVWACGHEQDTVFQLENLGRANCLQMRWYEN